MDKNGFSGDVTRRHLVRSSRSDTLIEQTCRGLYTLARLEIHFFLRILIHPEGHLLSK